MGWPNRVLILVMAILATNRISCIQFYPDDAPVSKEEAERFFFELDRDYPVVRNYNRMNGTSETRDNIGDIEVNNNGIENNGIGGYAKQVHAERRAPSDDKLQKKLSELVTELFGKHFTKNKKPYKPPTKLTFTPDSVNRVRRVSVRNPPVCGYKSSIRLRHDEAIEFYGVELVGSTKRPRTIIQKSLEKLLNVQETQLQKQITILVDVCKPVPLPNPNKNRPEPAKADMNDLLKNIEITITGEIKLLTLQLPKTTNNDVKYVVGENLQRLTMMQTIISKAFGTEDIDVDFALGTLVQNNILMVERMAQTIDGIAELAGYEINLADTFTKSTETVSHLAESLTFGGTISADGEHVHFMMKYAPLENAFSIPGTEINITDFTLILELKSKEFKINIPKKSSKGAPSPTSKPSKGGSKTDEAGTEETEEEKEADKPGITFYVKTDTDLLDLMISAVSEDVKTFRDTYFPIDTASWCLMGNTKETNFYGLIKKDIIFNCLNNPAAVKAATNGNTTQKARVPLVKSLNFASRKRSENLNDDDKLTAVPEPKNMVDSEAVDITNEKLAKGIYLTTIVDLTQVGLKCYGDNQKLFNEGQKTFKSWKEVNDAKKSQQTTTTPADTKKSPVVFLHPIQLAFTIVNAETTVNDETTVNAEPTKKPENNEQPDDIKSKGTEKQLTVRLPQGSEDISNFCRFCLLGVFTNAPNYLSDGNIKIDAFVYNFKTKAYTLGVSVKSGLEFLGMTIEEFKFQVVRSPITTQGKRSLGSTTTSPLLKTEIEGVAKVIIDGSKVRLAIKRLQNTWIINIATDSFTLGNIFDGKQHNPTLTVKPFTKRNVETKPEENKEEEEDSSVYKKVPEMFTNTGIKFFDVNIENQDSDAKTAKTKFDELIAVRCQPVILGFDQLYFNAKFVTKEKGKGQKWAVGVYMASANFSSIMKTIRGNEEDESSSSLSFLTGLSAIVAYNNFDNPITIKEDKTWKTKPSSQLSARSIKNVPTKQIVPRMEVDNNPLTLAFPGFTNEFKLSTKEFGFGLFWTIPKLDGKNAECRDSSLCSFLSSTLPDDTTISIQGKVTKKSFELAASITGAMFLKKGDYNMIALTKGELSIKVGVAAPEFKISAELKYSSIDKEKSDKFDYNQGMEIFKENANVQTLTFIGAVEITPTYIKLIFNMGGFVRVPDYFAIGDINLEAGFTMALGLPTIAFGLTFFIGDFRAKPETDKLGTAAEVKDKYINVIQLTGYIGINPVDPNDNYIYGYVNTLTLERICRAFAYKLPDGIPDVIRQTGFAAETSVSFSSSLADVEVGGIVIKPGFTLNGTFNFLGFEMYAGLEVSENGFKIDIATDPIDWAYGWIQVFKSEGDRENGPEFCLEVSNEEVSLTANVYINALKVFQGEAHIKIERIHIRIEISVKLYDMFLVDFHFIAFQENDEPFSIGAKINIGEFKSWLEALCKVFVENLLKSVKTISEGIKEIAEANKKNLESEQAIVKKWKLKVEEWKTNLKTKKKKLEEDAAAEQKSCDCGKVCVPFLTIKKECIWVWFHYLPCPWPDPCYSKITDPFCVLGCGAEKAWSAIVKWGKKALLEIGMALSDGANGLLGIADGYYEALIGFNAFVTQVFESIEKGAEKLKQLSDNVIRDLLTNLKSVEMNAKITEEFSACVSYEFTWDQDETTGGDVCLNVLALATTFTNLIMGQPKLKDTIENEQKELPEYEKKRKEMEAEAKELEEKKKESDELIKDTVKMEKFEQVQKAMKRSDVTHHDIKEHYAELKPVLDKLPKRENHQRSRVEKDILNYIRNSPVEKYDPRDDPSFRSFINRGPWHFDVRDEISHFAPTFAKNETSHSAWKRTLQFDSKLSPCNKMKRALNGFSDIANGLMDFTKSVDYTKSELEKASVGRKDKIANLHQKIKDQVSKYNITGEERESLNYIYENAVRGNADFTKRTDIAIQRSTSKTLPLVRAQINGLLRRDFGKNFYEMAEVMHGHAVEGYKRSGIPHAEDMKGETLLTNIKENLQDIISGEDDYDDDEDDDDEDVHVVALPKRLSSVKRDIISMQSFANRCA